MDVGEKQIVEEIPESSAVVVDCHEGVYFAVAVEDSSSITKNEEAIAAESNPGAEAITNIEPEASESEEIANLSLDGTTSETDVVAPVEDTANQSSYVHQVQAVEVPVEAVRVEAVKKDPKCKCATSFMFPHRVSKCALKNTSAQTALGVGAAASVAVAGCVAVGAVAAGASKDSKAKKEEPVSKDSVPIAAAEIVGNEGGQSSATVNEREKSRNVSSGGKAGVAVWSKPR